jgi:mitochondrial inner membrane protease subunit 1
MWLEGDNSSNSTDSRVYGAVPQAMLKGRVWLKLWPLTGSISLHLCSCVLTYSEW